MTEFRRALKDPSLLSVLIMGFSSGLPLLLIGSTLKTWLTERHVSLSTIGAFSLVGLPYTWKFIWSPVMDRFVPPLGRRRGWLVLSQVGIMLALVALSFAGQSASLTAIAGCAFLVAVFSASQDIVVDAYRREILPDSKLGLGSSLYVNGYRTAMLVAGAGSLIFADHIPWREVYWIMSALMLIGILTALLSPEPQVDVPPPSTLKESVLGPLTEFFQRDAAWSILAFILLYKIGESMASDMYNPFFITLGFTKTQIATVSKLFGFWATLGGSLAGGLLIIRFGIYRSLWIFGVAQSLALPLFSLLAYEGLDVNLLALSVAVENFTSGMATSAFVAFMASQTNKRFTATQLALMSSLTGVPRTLFGATTGVLANQVGWIAFFILCSSFTLPGLLMLFKLKPLLKPSPELTNNSLRLNL